MYPLIAGFLGAVVALSIFPHDLLLGMSPYWDKVTGDNAANWIGYEVFARDSWHWPVFKTTLLAPPEGVNVLFTDLMPGLALLGKVIFKTTGYLFNYFGPWLLLSYALQPVVAYLLLRKISLSKLSAFAGSLLFLLVPAFIFRYGHFPLLGHWLLLVSFLFYFAITQNGSRSMLLTGALFTFAIILINPYLLMMAIAIYCAALFDGALKRKITLFEAAASCSALAVSVGGAALLFGFIEIGKPSEAGGFGIYSMNLLSPVVPQLSSWPGHEKLIIQGVPGQYEGYNYLGLGIIGLIVVAVVFGWRPMQEFVKRSPVLIITAGLMSVYALSNRIYAGNVLLADIPIDSIVPLAKLTGIFRSSGRFFWPMGYVLLTIALYALHKRLGQRTFVGIVTIAVTIQAVDIRPLIASVSDRAAETTNGMDRSVWLEVARAHDEILVLPQFLCMHPEDRKSAYNFGVLAARLGIPTNSAIINRSDIDCPAEKVASVKRLKALATGDTPLIFALKRDFSSAVISATSMRDGLACRDIEFAYVCSSQEAVIADLGSELTATPSASLGKEFTVQSDGNGLIYLTAGWSDPGPWGIWGLGEESAFHMNFAQEVCRDVELTAKVMPYSHGKYIVSTGTLLVNSNPVGSISVSQGGEQIVNIRIPVTECAHSLDVSFKFSNLKSPSELGASNDPRRFNWALQSFTFRHAH
jgi:hypothetical protein